MRNQWRWLLLLRRSSQSRPLVSASTPLDSQVHSVRTVSSPLISPRAHPVIFGRIQSPIVRFYSSSDLAVEPPKEPSDENGIAVLTNIFIKNFVSDKIKQELESNNIVITHDLVLTALKSLQTAPDAARRLFKWVLRNENDDPSLIMKILSSQSYNVMLGVLVDNGFVREFWDMVRLMNRKGFGVSKATFVKAMEKFEKGGLQYDVEKLSKLYAAGSTDNSVENICSRVCRVIRQDFRDDNITRRLRDLNVEFSSQLVSMVLQNLGCEVSKGLLVFRWLEESGLFKHDEQTYSAMLRVLASKGSNDMFWRVVDELRNAGYEMNKDTYVYILERFVKKLMIKDAVDLYEFAMGGSNKPSVHDCTFLLKKIVVRKDLDLDLFSRVLRIFKDNGNVITNSTIDAVLKSLTSVGRVGECNKILKEMKDVGFVTSTNFQSKVAFQLSKDGKHKEASEFMDNLEEDESGPNHKTWASLVEGYCLAGDLENASVSLRNMVEKVGPSTTGYILELLVSVYCRKSRAADAYNLVSEMISEKGLQPWHSTYKSLIGMLLAQGGFKQALDVLPLMKSQGYPPFLEPFVEYLSKSGSPDDAIAFSKAMTVKRFPSTAVFLQLFETYFKVGRQNEAQDLLSKSPGYIKNHADVLNLFCSMKAGDTAHPTVVSA